MSINLVVDGNSKVLDEAFITGLGYQKTFTPRIEQILTTFAQTTVGQPLFKVEQSVYTLHKPDQIMKQVNKDGKKGIGWGDWVYYMEETKTQINAKDFFALMHFLRLVYKDSKLVTVEDEFRYGELLAWRLEAAAAVFPTLDLGNDLTIKVEGCGVIDDMLTYQKMEAQRVKQELSLGKFTRLYKKGDSKQRVNFIGQVHADPQMLTDIPLYYVNSGLIKTNLQGMVSETELAKAFSEK